MSADRDCEDCSHCQTINDDRDNYCHLQQRVAYEPCEKFDSVYERATPQNKE